MTPTIAAIALLLDALLGWPDWVYRRIGHPVTWLGRLISVSEARWNKGRHRIAKGAFVGILIVSLAALTGAILQSVFGIWIAGLLAWPLVASRSLYEHVQAVAQPLCLGDVAAARQATAMIVGRDLSQADEPGAGACQHRKSGREHLGRGDRAAFLGRGGGPARNCRL